MPSPFPGMDPYLENPARWPDFHLELISVLKQALNDQLQPRYYALAEERVYVSREDDPGRQLYVPDVSIRVARNVPPRELSGATAVSEPIEVVTMQEEEVHEPYVSIYDSEGHQIVSVIEVLSPSNKIVGSEGFRSYRGKRMELQRSSTNLLEIDLLRTGARMLRVPEVEQSDYHVHLSAHGKRPMGSIWPILLSQHLPAVRLPLLEKDPDARLDLQTVFNTVYDRSHYQAIIDYSRDPIPSLPEHYSQWANDLLRTKGLRKP
jgi:hypothetical protein